MCRKVMKIKMLNKFENKISGKMRCANLHAVNDLRSEKVDIPVCMDDEVLVKIKRCGICGSDIGRVFYDGTYHFPTIPGHEFSGEIAYDNGGELIGRRVAVFPLLPCFQCEMCKEENYAECNNYDYYGSRRDGGYAEYISVKKFNLVELPDNVTYEEGAMCEPASVAHNAVKKLGIKEGDTLLITGAGTIGLIAAQWAIAFGASKVMFVDLDKEKIDFCKKLGFDEYKQGEKVDAAIEGTGAGNALEVIIGAVKAFGTIILMGNPSRDMTLPKRTYQNILRSGFHIKGIWNSYYGSSDNDWKASLCAMSDGKINVKPLISHVFGLSECKVALELMRDKKEFYCKVMIDNEK